MGYFDKKSSMTIRALSHAAEMAQKYGTESSTSACLTTIYSPSFNPPLVDGKPSRIQVVDADSVGAAFAEYSQNRSQWYKPCILNFASYKNPGGKFLEGSTAQEESLCHESNLYNILEKLDKTYYLPHRGKGMSNRALYANEALFSPDVIFSHDNVTLKFDVLTCAAPNYAAASRYYDVTSKENAEVLYDRIIFLRKILETNNVKTVILGAFGCGVFGQDPNLVASYMNQIFQNSSIDTIIYAIPKNLNERNYIAFKNRIAET